MYIGNANIVTRATVIDHLKECNISETNQCIHFFFDNSQATPVTLKEMLRGIIKQALAKIEKALGLLPERLNRNVSELFGEFSRAPSLEQLSSLFENVVDMLPGTLYVIDGFDGMVENDILDMFTIIRKCFSSLKLHRSKLALFSREILGRGIDIRAQIQHSNFIRLQLRHVQKDIETFVDTRIDLMQLRRIITTNENLISEIREELKANSEKMYVPLNKPGLLALT